MRDVETEAMDADQNASQNSDQACDLVLRPQSRSQQGRPLLSPPTPPPAPPSDTQQVKCGIQNGPLSSGSVSRLRSGSPSGSGSGTAALLSGRDVHEQHAGAGEDARPAAGSTLAQPNSYHAALASLPNELLFQILGYLDVNDLLSMSRVNHHLRTIAVTPILHSYRLRYNRAILPPLLTSPSRPTLHDLKAKSIFHTHTSVLSRRLARSLVSIRLSRRLAARPTAESLVQRAVLPPECLPSGNPVAGFIRVAPALVARRKAIEKERVKDGLRRWVGSVWRGQVSERSERVRLREELFGVGRVWKLRRFWERMGRGENALAG
jgi:hypothetical protein